MKYIVRCKKTLYYDWVSNKFGDSRKKMSNELKYEDILNNMVVLVSKVDQIAIINEDTNSKLTLDVLAGRSYEISQATAHQYFDLIYLDDMCFETKQKLLKKIDK